MTTSKPPKMFTGDYFTDTAATGPGSWLIHVVPRLNFVRPPIRWLEIGSWEGRSALWTADNVLLGPEDRVVCVDPWPAGWADKAEGLFDQNTKDDRRIVKMKGDSSQMLPILRDHMFHGVYVDGLPNEKSVYQDACHAARLLVPGGIVIFGSYGASEVDIPTWGVKKAVDRFLAEMGEGIETIFKGWQLIAQLKGELK